MGAGEGRISWEALVSQTAYLSPALQKEKRARGETAEARG